MSESVDEVISDVMARETRNRQALSMLLEQQRDMAGHHLALHTHMGETSSYVTAVTMNWVNEHVSFAGDLPIFKSIVDEKSKKVPVDENTIGEIQQRQPDWRRQLPMAFYLATRKNHKFPPLLVVGYQDWVYNEDAEEWGIDKRAMRSSLTVKPLEPDGIYCDLDDKDTNFYALDGQHRLMAIQGLKILLSTGHLPALDSDRKPRRTSGVTRDDVIQHIRKETNENEGDIHARLEKLMFERIGIEIIPSVNESESYREALFRLRGIFVDVNENAKKLTKGEIVQLDEIDGFRVVARNIMVSHPLLKGKGRVDQKSAQLSESSESYTTLQSLVEIARGYLGEKERFSSWKTPIQGDRNLGFMRPSEPELDAGVITLSKYFDALMTLPSHRDFIQGKKAEDIRNKNGEDNILFRPIAQMALAEAVALLDNKMSLEAIMHELARQEERGQLKLRDRKAPWFGVLCGPDEKMRRQKAYQTLCTNLFCYLLGGGIGDDDDRAALQSEFANARCIDDDVSVNMDGDRVPLNKVLLPSPWR